MPFSYTVKKGDTANAIASRYGFKDYKDAGISSFPSGNPDLIREGETLTLSNYDPNQIKSFTNTPPIISSTDNKLSFQQDADTITGIDTSFQNRYDGKLEQGASYLYADGKTHNDSDPIGYRTSDGKNNLYDTGQKQEGGDPVFNELQKAEEKKKLDLAEEERVKKENYQRSYDTSLASLDSTARATIDMIMSSYDKRVAEQNRINKLNIDRTKAYGLASGGQYTPIDFGDAISLREQEASDKIATLENERINLIQKAKSARDEGASKLLREHLQDLDKVDNDIRAELKAVAEESEKKYKLLRDERVEAEKQAKERQAKYVAQITAIAPMYSDQYEKMTPEQRDAFIKQLVAQTGVDYPSVYGALEAGMLSSKKAGLDIEGKLLENSKKRADIAKMWSDDKVTPEKMSQEAPKTFLGEDDFKAKMVEFVRKYGSQGATYWDKVYQKDSKGDYTYEVVNQTKAPETKTSSKAPKTMTKVINGETVILEEGTDGKWYPK